MELWHTLCAMRSTHTSKLTLQLLCPACGETDLHARFHTLLRSTVAVLYRCTFISCTNVATMPSKAMQYSVLESAALLCMKPFCMTPHRCQICFDLALDAALHQPYRQPYLHGQHSISSLNIKSTWLCSLLN